MEAVAVNLEAHAVGKQLSEAHLIELLSRIQQSPILAAWRCAEPLNRAPHGLYGPRPCDLRAQPVQFCQGRNHEWWHEARGEGKVPSGNGI